MQDPRETVGTKRAAPGGRPQKWVLSDRGRELINALYDGTTARITLLERELRVPRNVVHHWACEMGLARNKRDMEWSAEDIAYLQQNYSKKSLNAISKHLKRSEQAIRYKAYKLSISSYNHYTATDLKIAFGCRYERIQMWVSKGWLKGFRKEKDAYRGDPWQFTEKAIRDFIIRHPSEIDQRRVDWLWFIDILAGGDGLGRLDDVYRGE